MAKAKNGGSPDVFPKIVADAKLKQITVKIGGCDVRFDDLELTSGQIERLSSWVGDKESHVRVTIEQVQGNLPFDED